MNDLEKLKYPLGRFIMPLKITAGERMNHIGILQQLPQKVRQAVTGLSDLQLDTPYRVDGWTIRQVVHHLADSHINCYCRIKLAVTEENPVIRPYHEERWAVTADGSSAPATLSLNILDAVHARLVWFLEKLPEADWIKTYYNPESKISYTIESAVAMYAWHSGHHLAHITNLKIKNGW